MQCAKMFLLVALAFMALVLRPSEAFTSVSAFSRMQSAQVAQFAPSR